MTDKEKKFFSAWDYENALDDEYNKVYNFGTEEEQAKINAEMWHRVRKASEALADLISCDYTTAAVLYNRISVDYHFKKLTLDDLRRFIKERSAA